MEQFYEVWKICPGVISLQTKFGQIIEAFNLRFNQLQAQRGMSLNRIATGVAVLALISDELSAMLGVLKPDHLQLLFAVVAVWILARAIVPDLRRAVGPGTAHYRGRAFPGG